MRGRMLTSRKFWEALVGSSESLRRRFCTKVTSATFIVHRMDATSRQANLSDIYLLQVSKDDGKNKHELMSISTMICKLILYLHARIYMLTGATPSSCATSSRIQVNASNAILSSPCHFSRPESLVANAPAGLAPGSKSINMDADIPGKLLVPVLLKGGNR